MENIVLESISANVNANSAQKIVEQEYGLVSDKIRKLDGYNDVNFHLVPPVTVKEGFFAEKPWPHGYTLKIINYEDSRENHFFEEYTNVLLHLKNEGVSCPCPVKNIAGNYLSYWISPERKYQRNENKLKLRRHIVLLLTYVPGESSEKINYNEKIIFSLGYSLRQLHVKLQPFCNSKALHRTNFRWSLMSVPDIENSLDLIPDKKNRLLAFQSVKEFKERALSNIDLLEKGVVHGDLNYANVLVRKLKAEGEDSYEISGIIDFTDMHTSFYLFDMAVAACYISLADVDRCEDSLALFLLGYQKRPLTNLEFQLLKVCICARLSQSIVLGLQSLITDPENDYVKNSTSMLYGWNLLHKLSKISDEEFSDILCRKMSSFGGHYTVSE